MYNVYDIGLTSTLRLFWNYWINVSLLNSAAFCLSMTKCLYEGQITQVVLESKDCMHAFAIVFNYERFFVSKQQSSP